jgi:hypothetical protein
MRFRSRAAQRWSDGATVRASTAAFVSLFASLVVSVSPTLADEPALGPFGIESFTTSVSTTQAGAHPDVGTEIRFASQLDPYASNNRVPNEGPHNLIVNAPAGLVGDLTAVPTCSTTDFQINGEEVQHEPFGCSAATQVGTATVLYAGSKHVGWPVVLLEHGADQVARLGVEGTIPTVINISLRTGTDYGITATIEAIPHDRIYGLGLQLWGIPAEHARGCQSLTESTSEGEPHPAEVCVPETPPSPPSQWRPFMTNPTTCPSGPLTTTLSVDSNQHPERYITASAEQAPPTGCTGLAFNPSISIMPDTVQADAPSGYTVDLAVPQNVEPDGFASSELRKAVVTLPPGLTLDPSVATGLQACSDAQFGMGTTSPPECPTASMIGTNEVISPDVPEPLHGQVYVGAPEPGNMYRIFQNIEGDGLDVKLEGTASPNPVTGQITATFDNLPQLPFSEFKLHFKGGNTAPLANPPTCGRSTTTTDLMPWSGNPDATPSSSFEVSSDGLGGGCPTIWPFTPVFSAGSNSLVAGAGTTFSLTLTRADQTQYLGGLSAHLPPGLVGDLASVPLCPATQAAAGTCSAASEIGTVSAEAGVGETPFTLPGTVYLAQPRIVDSPASLSVVVPAIAGPYNLGNVVVGADIRVDNDGSVTASSDPLPTILDGVPLRIRQIGLDITRPGFMINPTSCAPMSVNATILSTQAQSVAASSPFQLADCQALAFSPTFAVSTQAATNKANGASLAVKITSGSGQANIAKVDVALPKQLPTRLTTLQKACTEVQFASDPAGCPEASVVGAATAHTPLLNGPLTGPAILVSHGGAAFPDLVLVLQGQGITIRLTGNTDIKGGITYSKFEAVPDVPVSAFELRLPESPYSILATNIPAAANGSMCDQSLTMPTTIIAQNGAEVDQKTKITVAGCPRAKPSVKITKEKLEGNKLLVTVTTSVSGMLQIGGKGLKATTKKGLMAGAHQIEVPLARSDGGAKRDRRTTELRASLAVRKQMAAKTTTGVKL